MTKKDEAVGKALLSTVKEAVKESTGATSGAAKEVSDMLDQAIGMQQTVTVTLYRVDAFSGQDQFLSNIGDVPPQLIKDRGLDALIKEWSGGGKYRGVIRGAGIPDKPFTANIHGNALDPRPTEIIWPALALAHIWAWAWVWVAAVAGPISN